MHNFSSSLRRKGNPRGPAEGKRRGEREREREREREHLHGVDVVRTPLVDGGVDQVACGVGGPGRVAADDLAGRDVQTYHVACRQHAEVST